MSPSSASSGHWTTSPATLIAAGTTPSEQATRRQQLLTRCNIQAVPPSPTPPGWKLPPTNSKRPSCCSTACRMKSSVASVPPSNLSSWDTVAIANWRGFSAWTRKTPDKIAQLLQQTGIPISTNTVARLLHGMNYSLHLNRKQLATGSSPDRDQQFQRRHQEAGTGRQFQKLRRQVGPLAAPGE